ncbi:MAG: cell division FtsK/SpoIIIE [Microgenomates group bacterium GW2011_GWF2_45_18]|nr:MAG: cell division FtsK/SpoIIIE [Microgenomates group bacterium GW2011_GWF1_44_10]KKU01927.1 MAG: cell division FtsK/SpoIIIE [Microgenomates group bacterium GW2011_GWF2_45_18]OGJ41339.1 MAG: hypothetical protein A2378_01200 [Candidatus Pacebacteria bacterium RIFOXYB1_FULL_44_10]HAU98758.1 DNA translocase FtsK [Candidatus Paceibacterota bacterium]HAX01422.1 DNA translocase FtsK [Candidatus Paceibacterota bacterium]
MPKKRGRKKQVMKMRLRLETVYSLASLVFFALGILLIVSFLVKESLLFPINQYLVSTFGLVATIVPFLCFSAGLMLTGAKWSFAKPQVLFGGLLLTTAIAGIIETGTLGSMIFSSLAVSIQPIGAYTVLVTGIVAGIVIMSDTSIKEIFSFIFNSFEFYSEDKSASFSLPKIGLSNDKKSSQPLNFIVRNSSNATQKNQEDEKTIRDEKKQQFHPDSKQSFIVNQPKLQTSSQEKGGIPTQAPDQVVWQYPPISLLSPKDGGKADRGDVKQNAHVIQETLESFGIKAVVREVNEGPAVTQYALQIALGTKLSKITALANDLALALAAPTGQIRIEAPIPGRSYVGIEIPNRSPEFVTMRPMLAHESMKNAKSKLVVALGLNVAGQPVVADISKMPHVLIAGATGSGKSVAINSFLASILFRASPQEVKLILVDPKRVELTGYNDIPHLLTPVIVEPDKVVRALKWAQAEMDRRYKMFAEVGVRNIEGYNELAGFQALPYILIVIDELADIMLYAPADVEDSITRLAQMARATGMHLILATQRPSVDVITGLIKANIPARIAFNVSSMMDSRVILDMPGAEKLLGRGDMLYIPPDQAKPTRIQGTYVSDAEIRSMLQFIKQNGAQPEYQDEVLTKFSGKASSGGAQQGETDEHFRDAVQFVVETGKASASILQRRYSVGYNRAARIVDQMQIAGIVGPQDGSKPREVNREVAQQVLSGDTDRIIS